MKYNFEQIIFFCWGEETAKISMQSFFLLVSLIKSAITNIWAFFIIIGTLPEKNICIYKLIASFSFGVEVFLFFAVKFGSVRAD